MPRWTWLAPFIVFFCFWHPFFSDLWFFCRRLHGKNDPPRPEWAKKLFFNENRECFWGYRQTGTHSHRNYSGINMDSGKLFGLFPILSRRATDKQVVCKHTTITLCRGRPVHVERVTPKATSGTQASCVLCQSGFVQDQTGFSSTWVRDDQYTSAVWTHLQPIGIQNTTPDRAARTQDVYPGQVKLSVTARRYQNPAQVESKSSRRCAHRCHSRWNRFESLNQLAPLITRCLHRQLRSCCQHSSSLERKIYHLNFLRITKQVNLSKWKSL